LLISHDQLLRGGIGECRNKSLQLMFQLMGAGDKAGSGMDKIRTSWADARFRSPRIRETQHPDRVALTLPMVSTLSDVALASIRHKFEAKMDLLKPEQVKILVMALDEGAITNARLQKLLTIHRTDLTKTLQQLVRDGFLGSEGTGRGTRYELRQARNKSSASLSSTADVELATVSTSVTRTVSSSVSSLETADDAGALWSELMALATPARGSHLPQAAMRELVMKLLHFFSAEIRLAFVIEFLAQWCPSVR
jgi:ATP-dependent DNA helicase RecG